MTEPIPWDDLRAEARDAARRAYAPYSGLRAGAAGLVDDGEIVTGCNVENASYGLTLCAECGLVSDLHDSGGGRLIAVVVVAADGDPLTPCGRCRQLLVEHGGGECLIDAPDGPRRLDSLLPDAFLPGDLDERSG
ncbi:MAG TPA: cytidine deaminase [Actinomycetota bacterium]|jgi:cytidine deaminase|nr:cytidine deaminase [Actinomycetota bacterium]